MDKSRKGVVSYHQLCELVYDEEAAAQVRVRLQQPASLPRWCSLVFYIHIHPDTTVFNRVSPHNFVFCHTTHALPLHTHRQP